ncbi:hypothetical protein QTP70_027650, partial [Hemibagrus guttatus]
SEKSNKNADALSRQNPPVSGVMGGLIPRTAVPASLQQVVEAVSVVEAHAGPEECLQMSTMALILLRQWDCFVEKDGTTVACGLVVCMNGYRSPKEHVTRVVKDHGR